MRAAILALALAFAPLAHADDEACKLPLGRGWPPATENYGTAVEQLFAGEQQPAWSFTLLPRASEESGVLLIPGADPESDWTLRRAVAEQRVHYWGPTELELRTQQTPEAVEAPVPAAVATRFVQAWHDALSSAAPEGSTVPFSDDGAWLFLARDPGNPGQVLRVSGLKPTCELGALMRDQIDLLIEASDEDDEKREKRWRQLGESLDRMRDVLAAAAATAAQ